MKNEPRPLRFKTRKKKYIILYKGKMDKRWGKFRTKGSARSMIREKPLSIRKDYEIKEI